MKTERRITRVYLTVLVALALLASILGPVRPALAAPTGDPVLGGQLFATGGAVEVEVKPASAGITSTLSLYEPPPVRALATNRDVGRVVQLGSFPAGVELIFGISYGSTVFKMGPADRNPDGIPHAVVTPLGAGTVRVGFEDLFGGGDRDYDDNVFEFRGAVSLERPKLVADAGPDQTVPEGAVVTLDASASKRGEAGSPVAIQWRALSHSGPPVVLSSTRSAKPTFQTYDDGTYLFEVTASDSESSTVDTVEVRVANQVPVISTRVDPAATDGLALLATSFTDPGPFDVHTATVTWGDGTAAEQVPASAQGTGWGYALAGHRYAANGVYSASVQVTDDDGGRSLTAVVSIDAGGAGTDAAPVGPALWAQSVSALDAIRVAGTGHLASGLVHSNADIRISGSKTALMGGTEYVTKLTKNGAGGTIDPAPLRVQPGPFPLAATITDYRPGGPVATAPGAAYTDASAECQGGATGTWNPQPNLAPGTYYAGCGVHLSGSGILANVTIAAEGPIKVSGSGVDLTAFNRGRIALLSASSDARAVDISGAGGSYHGYLVAPRGGIDLSGAGLRVECGAVAQTIAVTGANDRFDGSCETGTSLKVIPVAAPPVLVPKLDQTLAGPGGSILPGQALSFASTTSNAGALLLEPGILGLVNRGVVPATVTGVSYALEYLDRADATWKTLAATTPPVGTVALSGRPLPTPGVSYPSAGDGISGTVVLPGATAGWASAAVITLDPAAVNLLVDPDRVTAVRNVVHIAVNPGPAVRQIARFDDDLLGRLRDPDLSAATTPNGADLDRVSVTVTRPTGDPAILDSTSLPALAHLTPGAAATGTVTTSAPSLAGRGADESEADYLDRLHQADGSLIGVTALARAVSPIGPALSEQRQATVKLAVPVVHAVLRGPEQVARGATATWSVSFTNRGGAPATALMAALQVGGSAVALSGVPATLEPGATATATATVTAPESTSNPLLEAAATATWADGPNRYGPSSSTASTRIDGVGPGTLTLSPGTTTGPVGRSVAYTVSVVDNASVPAAGAIVTLRANGANPRTQTAAAGPDGLAHFSFTPTAAGEDELQALASVAGSPSSSNLAHAIWTANAAGGGGNGGNGGNGPAVSGVTPSDGTTLTTPTRINATLAAKPGTTVTGWTVTIRPGGSVPGADERQLASGATGNPSATVEPGALPNGIWLVRVSALDSTGGATAIDTSVVIDGNLKLGRYSTTYNDLDVAVAGIPVQVLRTYDTLQRSTSGDFGNGWRLQLSSFRVQVNRPLGQGGWTRFGCGSGLVFVPLCYRTDRPHYVTVTWPDGHTESFDFAPQGLNTFFPIGAIPAYTARPSSPQTQSRLEPAPEDQSAASPNDGNIYAGGFGEGPIYNPQRFVLVARNGTRYLLDTTSGLVEATTSNGNVVRMGPGGATTSSGPQVSIRRDAVGRITDVDGPVAGQHHGYAYDAAGDLVAVTDPNNHTVRYHYGPGHLLLQTTDPNDRPLQTLTYDPVTGRLASVATGSQPPVRVSADPASRQETVSDANGRLTTIFTYDVMGDVVQQDQVFDGKRLSTKLAYDAAGRVRSVTDPLLHSVSYEYDAAGNLLTSTDANHHTWSFEGYNTLGQPGSVVGPGRVTVSTLTYDSHGNTLTKARPGEAPYQYAYNRDGTLHTVTTPSGRLTTFSYDSSGHLLAATDQAGRSIGFTVDAAGKVRAVVDQLGNRVDVAYDGLGNPLSVQDGNRHTWTYHYNEHNLVDRITDPLTRSTLLEYDDQGLIARRTDRDGRITTFAYDASGRKTLETQPGPEVTRFTYDPIGRLIHTDDPDSQVDFGYDDANHLVSQRSAGTASAPAPDVELTYTVEPTGALGSATGPNGTTGYRYDDLGRLAAITDSAHADTIFSYNPQGRLDGVNRPNGVTEALSYTADGELTGRRSTLGTTPVAKAEYGIDPVTGRRTSLADLDGAHTYAYDDSGRLTQATHPAASGLTNEAYTYDAAGNRTSWPGSPAAAVAYDPGDHLRRDGAFDYTFDGEGHLWSKRERATGALTVYDWNALGELTAVHLPDGTTSTYRYDALGRRIEVVDHGRVARYVYDGANVRLVYDGGGAVQSSYTTGTRPNSVNEEVRGAARSFPLQDGVGSTTAASDTAGQVTATWRYDAYGKSSGANPPGDTTYGYGGQQRDASTGLDYARARYYDPATGRFLSEDPVPAVNPYPYAAGDPVSLVDPLGTEEFAEESELNGADAEASEGLANNIYRCSDAEVADFGSVFSSFGGGLSANLKGVLGELAVRLFADSSFLYHGGSVPGTGPGGVRYPDFIRGNDILEVKNVKSLSNTQQIRDLTGFVDANEGNLEIFTRQNTTLSGPLQEAVNAPGSRIRIIQCLPG